MERMFNRGLVDCLCAYDLQKFAGDKLSTYSECSSPNDPSTCVKKDKPTTEPIPFMQQALYNVLRPNTPLTGPDSTTSPR